MEQKNLTYNSEHSIAGLMLDYINFTLVLFLGFIFNWQSENMACLFLIQVALLIISLALFPVSLFFKDLFNGDKTPPFPLFELCFFGILGTSLIGLAHIVYPETKYNILTVVLYLPSILYANKSIFIEQKNRKLLDSFTMIKGFLKICFLPLLLFGPTILKNIGLPDTLTFFTCYSILCFPFKKTFQVLASKPASFLLNPDKLFALVFTGAALMFLFFSCYAYWLSGGKEASELIGISIILLIFGILILWKG